MWNFQPLPGCPAHHRARRGACARGAGGATAGQGAMVVLFWPNRKQKNWPKSDPSFIPKKYVFWKHRVVVVVYVSYFFCWGYLYYGNETRVSETDNFVWIDLKRKECQTYTHLVVGLSYPNTGSNGNQTVHASGFKNPAGKYFEKIALFIFDIFLISYVTGVQRPYEPSANIEGHWPKLPVSHEPRHKIVSWRVGATLREGGTSFPLFMSNNWHLVSYLKSCLGSFKFRHWKTSRFDRILWPFKIATAQS